MAAERASRQINSAHRVLGGALLAVLCGLAPSRPTAQVLDIRWFTVDGGGATASTGGGWSVGGTVGQPDAGPPMGGGPFTIVGGFWTAAAAPSADLAISTADSPDPVVPGSNFSYHLQIGNAGPGPASDLVVTDTLPAAVSFVGVAGTDWGCSHSAGIVTCTLSALLPGTAPLITIEVTAPASGATLVNAADVAGSTPDPNLANNSDTETTTVLAAADLSIASWGDPGPVPPDVAVTYTLDVANDGPDPAAAVTVTDDLPPEAAFQSAGGTGWACGEAGGTVTCTLPSLAAGTGASPISVVVTTPDASVLMTNWASVIADTFDPVAGNNSDSATTEVDGDPPQVVAVASAADTGDGRISAGEAVAAAVTQLIALFSEEVADPPGDTDPDDVTNTANYLVVSSGGDGAIDTSSCAAGVAPSDSQVPVGQVLYDGQSTTAFVTVSDGGGPLPGERYRLLVCGSTSIVDLVGLTLDGDGDGSGGDDHLLDFSVGVRHLLLNPNFDVDLSHWTVTSPLPGEVSHSWEDADGVLASGSTRVVNLSGPGGVYSLQQCVPVVGGQFYRLASRVQLSSVTPGAPTASGVADFFTVAGCAGALSGSLPSAAVTGDTGGAWSADLRGLVQAPPDSASVRVGLVVDAGSATDFEVHFDNVSFADHGFFADDFETGDTDRWSSTVGGAP